MCAFRNPIQQQIILEFFLTYWQDFFELGLFLIFFAIAFYVYALVYQVNQSRDIDQLLQIPLKMLCVVFWLNSDSWM